LLTTKIWSTTGRNRKIVTCVCENGGMWGIFLESISLYTVTSLASGGDPVVGGSSRSPCVAADGIDSVVGSGVVI
jgi:hypothetical protein